MTLTITANIVAWYAALVGTGSLAVSFYNAWRDRVHLRVTASAGYRVPPGTHPYDPTKLYINVVVANRGRRPTTVEKVWLTTKGAKGGKLLNDSFLLGARELKEGTAASYLVDQTLLHLDDITSIVAQDQTGRQWRGRLERER